MLATYPGFRGSQCRAVARVRWRLLVLQLGRALDQRPLGRAAARGRLAAPRCQPARPVRPDARRRPQRGLVVEPGRRPARGHLAVAYALRAAHGWPSAVGTVLLGAAVSLARCRRVPAGRPLAPPPAPAAHQRAGCEWRTLAAVDENDTVVVKVVGSEGEADIVCGLLRAAGIECSYRDTEALDSLLRGVHAGRPAQHPGASG